MQKLSATTIFLLLLIVIGGTDTEACFRRGRHYSTSPHQARVVARDYITAYFYNETRTYGVFDFWDANLSRVAYRAYLEPGGYAQVELSANSGYGDVYILYPGHSQSSHIQYVSPFQAYSFY